MSNVVIGSWCGGLTLTPADRAGEYLLAATPVYLTSEDIVRLVAIRFGVVDDEFASWVEAWASEPAEGETEHDQIARYWDRLP